MLLSAVLVVFSGCLIYYVITTRVKQESIEKLLVNSKRVVEQLEEGNLVAQLPPVLEIHALPDPIYEEATIIKDTIVYDPVEKEKETFIEISSIRNINGQFFKITMRQVIIEPHDYYNSIGLSLLLVLLVVLILFYYINRAISYKLWNPFYQNLETLKIFSLHDKAPLNLQTSTIKEFTELNAIIDNLTTKVRTDYQALKEFSENASHELQTPLAVIKVKLETLLNANDLSEEHLKIVSSINTNMNRLSKLNKDLLLLSKIENYQFNEREKIDLNEIIRNTISEFSELVKMGRLTLITDFSNSFEVFIDKSLALIMISNLFSNAIKYTPSDGVVNIKTERKKLMFSNTGESELKSKTKIFERFYKNEQSANSAGLGLAIVKRVCDINNINIYYDFQHQTHRFILEF